MFKTLTYHLKFKNVKDNNFRLLLRLLCHVSKSVYNNALFELRQEYFKSNTIPTYFELNKICKTKEDSKILNSYMVLCTNRDAYNAMSNFIKGHIKLPRYLEKKGYYPIITEQIQMEGNTIRLPVSNLIRTGNIFNKQFMDKEIQTLAKNIDVKIDNRIKIPKYIQGKEIKRMSILPRINGKLFEVKLTYVDDETETTNGEKFMGIDLGVKNLLTCVDSDNKSFIVDGKECLSVNRLYNMKLGKCYAQVANDPQRKLIVNGKQKINYATKQIQKLYLKRMWYLNTYMDKAARIVIDYCKSNGISTIMLGYNRGFKSKGFEEGTNKEKARLNQNFLQIPHGRLKNRLIDLCSRNGITINIIDESYTSLVSFYDDEKICKHNVYMGKRKGRLYETANGKIVNADVNGALNILRKGIEKHKPEMIGLISSLRNSGITVPVRKHVA